MQINFPRMASMLGTTVLIVTAMLTTSAHAVPSFARQTGQECAACHIGAFGPQLTPFGMRFKLGGYVDSDGKSGKIPLSAMVVADYTKYKDDNGDTTSKTGLAEASVFLAGKLADHLGTFTQVTNNGVSHTTSVDQIDLRYTGTLSIADQDALIGVSVNNNPTVQDPFNTLAQWGFPYDTSERVTGPGIDLLSASSAGRVIGVNAYSLINSNFYAEVGLYNTLSPAVQSRMGEGRYPDPDNSPGVPFQSLGNAPYWRLAYMKDMGSMAWNAGIQGFSGTFKDRITTDTNKYNDFAIDGTFQYLGTREHIFTVNGSYVREHTTDATDTGDTSNTTKNLRLNASYHFMNTYGATLGYFKATSEDQMAGNRGFVYQLDWTPWGKETSWNAPYANLRVGLQFIKFNRFVTTTTADDGTQVSSVMDKPGDMNSTRIFVWTAF